MPALVTAFEVGARWPDWDGGETLAIRLTELGLEDGFPIAQQPVPGPRSSDSGRSLRFGCTYHAQFPSLPTTASSAPCTFAIQLAPVIGAHAASVTYSNLKHNHPLALSPLQLGALSASSTAAIGRRRKALINHALSTVKHLQTAYHVRLGAMSGEVDTDPLFKRQEEVVSQLRAVVGAAECAAVVARAKQERIWLIEDDGVFNNDKSVGRTTRSGKSKLTPAQPAHKASSVKKAASVRTTRTSSSSLSSLSGSDAEVRIKTGTPQAKKRARTSKASSSVAHASVRGTRETSGLEPEDGGGKIKSEMEKEEGAARQAGPGASNTMEVVNLSEEPADEAQQAEGTAVGAQPGAGSIAAAADTPVEAFLSSLSSTFPFASFAHLFARPSICVSTRAQLAEIANCDSELDALLDQLVEEETPDKASHSSLQNLFFSLPTPFHFAQDLPLFLHPSISIARAAERLDIASSQEDLDDLLQQLEEGCTAENGAVLAGMPRAWCNRLRRALRQKVEAGAS
ncbi:hypothetical protein JCM10449v2_004462 [Rhodotorula kratochvilovae]